MRDIADRCEQRRFRDPIYRFPHTANIEASLRRLGLEIVGSRHSASAPKVFFVIAARQ
jgi:hypothetical protein